MSSLSLRETQQKQIPPAPLFQRGEKQACFFGNAPELQLFHRAVGLQLPPLKKGIAVCEAGGGGICSQQQRTPTPAAPTTNTRKALTS
jgi:hypothetical protein